MNRQRNKVYIYRLETILITGIGKQPKNFGTGR